MNKQLTEAEIHTIVKLVASLATCMENQSIMGNRDAFNMYKVRRQKLNDILFGLTTETLADYWEAYPHLKQYEEVGA